MFESFTLAVVGLGISEADNESALPVLLGQEMCLLSLIESFNSTAFLNADHFAIIFVILAIGACEASIWISLSFLQFNVSKTLDFDEKNVLTM